MGPRKNSGLSKFYDKESFDTKKFGAKILKKTVGANTFGFTNFGKKHNRIRECFGSK